VGPRQDMDLIYVRTQVTKAIDGFELCPGTSQNGKIWINYVRSWTPQTTKYGLIMSGHKLKS